MCFPYKKGKVFEGRIMSYSHLHPKLTTVPSIYNTNAQFNDYETGPLHQLQGT